jgi:hypothetical protein
MTIKEWLKSDTTEDLKLDDQAGLGLPTDLSLFDKLFEMDALLNYFDSKDDISIDVFIETLRKCEQKVDEQTFLKLALPNLTFDQIQDTLKTVFARLDSNHDGFLSEKDYKTYQTAVSLHTNTYQELVSKSSTQKLGISMEIFLATWKDEISKDKISAAKKLRFLGVDPCLHFHQKMSRSELSSVISVMWTLDSDQKLVRYVNRIWEKTGVESINLSPSCLCGHQWIKEIGVVHAPTHLAKLSNLTLVLRYRFGLLKIFSSFVSQLLPLIDLTAVNQGLGAKLDKSRSRIFFDVKNNFLHEILTKTCTNVEPSTIHINRIEAAKILDATEDKENPNCVFLQTMNQLSLVPSERLRQKDRCFKVIFKSEDAEGEVGPYRELLSNISRDLQSKAVPLLIPVPNQSGNVGENREKFLLNPGCHVADQLLMLEFLGKLMGMAVRSKNPLSLDLPGFFWEPFVGCKLTKQMLSDVDYNTVASLDKLESMDDTTFANSFFGNFTATLSNKAVVELSPGGADISVTPENKKEYLKLALDARLNESSSQMESLLKGFYDIVPKHCMALFDSDDARYLVTGSPEVDLELLKKHTQYRGGVAATDFHIINFWQVLAEFSSEEKKLFLRFAWGRERLPSENEFHEEMKIFPSTKSTDHDYQLPHSDTCFFNVTLPAYSSKKLMREKLLVAITNTMSMDGDSTTNEEGFPSRALNYNFNGEDDDLYM